MKLRELEVGELGLGLAGEQQAGAERAGRIGRPRPQRRGAAGGEDRGAGGDIRPVGQAHATVLEDRGRAMALEDIDAWMRDDRRGERPQDAPAGRAPARVDDPAPAVAALQPERELAAAVGVEVDAELLEFADAVGGLVGEGLGRGVAREAAAGRQRVLEVQFRRVVDRERGRCAALRPVGGGLGERAGGDERDAGALAGGRQSGEEPGRAGADHDEV